MQHEVEVGHDLVQAARVAQDDVLVAGTLDPHMNLVGVAVLHGLEHVGDEGHVPAHEALVLDVTAALHDLLGGEEARRVAQLVTAGGVLEALEHRAGLLDIAHEELEVESGQSALLRLRVLVDGHALENAGLALGIGVDLKRLLDLVGIKPANLSSLIERELLDRLGEQLAAGLAAHAVDLVLTEKRGHDALVHGVLDNDRLVLLGIPHDVVGVRALEAGLGRLERQARLGVDEIGHVGPGTAELGVELLVVEDPLGPGHQQGGVGTRANGKPHIGLGGIHRETRVNDDRLEALGTVAQLGKCATASGDGGVRRVGAPQDQARDGGVGVIVVPAVGVREREVVGLACAIGKKRGTHTGQVALSAARLPNVWGVDGLAKALDIGEVGVATAAGRNRNGLGAVLVRNLVDAGGDIGQGLVPGDALPVVAATLAHTTHGVLVAVGMIQGLNAGHTLGAHAAHAHRALWVALDANDAAVLDVSEHGAACDACAARRLDDLLLVGLLGTGGVGLDQVARHAHTQGSNGTERRGALGERTTRHRGLLHRDLLLEHVVSFLSPMTPCLKQSVFNAHDARLKPKTAAL